MKAYDSCRLQYLQKHKRNNETCLIHNTITISDNRPFLITHLIEQHGLEYIQTYFPHLRIVENSKYADTVLIIHEVGKRCVVLTDLGTYHSYDQHNRMAIRMWRNSVGSLSGVSQSDWLLLSKILSLL